MDARHLIAGTLLAVLAVGGCRRDEPVATAEPGALPAPPATTSATPTDVAPVMEPATALAVATAQDVGAHLVDGQGRALYAFSEDLGAATCIDACLQRWPALTIPVDQDAKVTAPVDAVLVGKFEREDGMLQATYANHPLYLYVGDTAAGQHTGHDLTDEFGHWSLVAPDGKPIAQKK